MKRTVGVIAGIGALLVAGSVAFAQGPGYGWGHGWGRGGGWGPGAGAELTQEERDAFIKLRQEHWAEMGKLRTQIYTKRSELLAARRAGDQAKTEALTKDLGTLYAEHEKKQEDFRAEASKLTGSDVPGPGFGPGYGRGGFGPGMGRGMMGRGMMGRGMGPGMGRGVGWGYGPACPMWN